MTRTDRQDLSDTNRTHGDCDHRSVTGHVASDGRAVGGGCVGEISDLAARHDRDAVGEFQDLVEVLRHQENGGAAVTLLHDLRPNVGDRGEVEAEAGIGDDEHVDVAGQLAREYGALHIAAREIANWASRSKAF